MIIEWDRSFVVTERAILSLFREQLCGTRSACLESQPHGE
jgi:hypothetical protein